jgi:hypothetical protein
MITNFTRNNFYGLVLAAISILLTFIGCNKTEMKVSSQNAQNINNNTANNLEVKNNQSSNKGQLITFGKWLALQNSDEDHNYFTYQVFSLKSEYEEWKDILKISDSKGIEIYREEFKSLAPPVSKGVLNDGSQQLLLFYNDGGSARFFKIIGIKDGKVQNLTNEAENYNGDLAFIPTATTSILQGANEPPLQIIDIGKIKVSSEKRKIIRVFRYVNNKYRFYGSAYYEDFIKNFNSLIKENGPSLADNTLRK